MSLLVPHTRWSAGARALAVHRRTFWRRATGRRRCPRWSRPAAGWRRALPTRTPRASAVVPAYSRPADVGRRRFPESRAAASPEKHVRTMPSPERQFRATPSPRPVVVDTRGGCTCNSPTASTRAYSTACRAILAANSSARSSLLLNWRRTSFSCRSCGYSMSLRVPTYCRRSLRGKEVEIQNGYEFFERNRNDTWRTPQLAPRLGGRFEDHSPDGNATFPDGNATFRPLRGIRSKYVCAYRFRVGMCS